MSVSEVKGMRKKISKGVNVKRFVVIEEHG